MSIIKKAITVKEIASLTGGQFKGDGDRIVLSVCDPSRYVKDGIAPLWEKKFTGLINSDMTVFTQTGWLPEGVTGVETAEPRTAIVPLLAFFDDAPAVTPGISPKASVAPSAALGQNIYIGAGAVIKENVRIGDNTIVMENAVVDAEAVIGRDAVIEPGVVIYHHSQIGDKCVIHSNAVIGCDGFGFLPDPKGGMLKIPQTGIVRLDEGVEIGACSAVDRATFGETHIGAYTKIDSHVKIGHNCQIGAYTIVVAQSGVAGSSRIGSGVILAAQSGVSNHAVIGDGVTVGGRGGVASDIPSGVIVSGFPAQDHKKELKQQVYIRQLPDMARELRELKKKLEQLQKKNEDVK